MLSLSVILLSLSLNAAAAPVPALQVQSLSVRQAPEKFVLPVPAEKPGTSSLYIPMCQNANLIQGPLFDASATRAATGAQIRNAASPDICFDVSNFRAGDFRFNLVPLALKKCDSSIDGQKFDLITKVAHSRAFPKIFFYY